MVLTPLLTLTATGIADEVVQQVALLASRGQTLPALINEYSDDGQHLNSVGQRRVAEALLTFLARLP